MKDFSINNLVRSAVLLAVGLPISLAVIAQVPEKEAKTEAEQLKSRLELPCLRYALTSVDSKGERSSKDAIDEVLGVDGADYKEVCRWTLN